MQIIFCEELCHLKCTKETWQENKVFTWNKRQQEICVFLKIYFLSFKTVKTKSRYELSELPSHRAFTNPLFLVACCEEHTVCCFYRFLGIFTPYPCYTLTITWNVNSIHTLVLNLNTCKKECWYKWSSNWWLNHKK